jgi:hypothetical protein
LYQKLTCVKCIFFLGNQKKLFYVAIISKGKSEMSDRKRSRESSEAKRTEILADCDEERSDDCCVRSLTRHHTGVIGAIVHIKIPTRRTYSESIEVVPLIDANTGQVHPLVTHEKFIQFLRGAMPFCNTVPVEPLIPGVVTVCAPGRRGEMPPSHKCLCRSHPFHASMFYNNDLGYIDTHIYGCMHDDGEGCEPRVEEITDNGETKFVKFEEAFAKSIEFRESLLFKQFHHHMDDTPRFSISTCEEYDPPDI